MEKKISQFSCVPYVDGKPMECDSQYITHFWDDESEIKSFVSGLAYGIELTRRNVGIVTYKNVGVTCDVYQLFDIFSLGERRPKDVPLILDRPEIVLYDGILMRRLDNEWITCESEAAKSHLEHNIVIWDIAFYQLDDNDLRDYLITHTKNTD